ncbi:HlyD family efflux transporter periplasmic adaptor subunit [Bacteroides sp. 224]|uniref:HlyD family efflux transporter periplasmic adaptor subunit n=1 Tax=Bacteroides sp. 224 TaxID=2302936 RepID=UPI0013D1C6CE|nr:HlyD family efflux transporter periplasmic adaptor subunit [Bacteroides sp. 224]NDV64204.1 HlyD family efflux transporter periplasmic adaptor subunit [Bacteroides sp. 224]
MNWKLLKLKPEEKENQNRSEEVSDIIDRMPTSFGKWVAWAVVIFTILLFTFGWLIKYPDVVSGQITINSNTAPIKLPAHTSGKIEILNVTSQDNVREGDYIAIIQNSAKTEDIRKVTALINEFDPNEYKTFKQACALFPEKVSLGELNMKYYSFLSSLKSITDYADDNQYEQQQISLSEGIKWREKILNETQNALNISTENLEISRKWLDKYSSLNKELITTYELEIDKSKADYLSAKQNNQNLVKEMASIEMQIAESRNRLSQLSVERREQERKLHLDLFASYHDLNDQLKQWEQTYVLKAPFDGQVEFLKFWTNGQFVQAGTDVFCIVPKENVILGQVLLPAIGAGKVKTGSNVSIKLDDYPYTEFGAIKGIVKSISLITNEYEVAQGKINTYLVQVDMPDGLVTNYGDELDFKYEIGGQADIIVKDRRLIERLFDNIKFNTK